MAFLDFGYYDSTSDTPSVSGLDLGSNDGRVALVAGYIDAGTTVASLTVAGEDMLPAIDTATAYTSFVQRAYAKLMTATGSQNLAANMTPAGGLKRLICATFDDIDSIRSAECFDSNGSAGSLSVTVDTVEGDIVVVLGSDLGIYDDFTATGGATTIPGSGFFIGAYKTAAGTSTTVTGTFASGSHNWQVIAFVLTPSGGGGGSAVPLKLQLLGA